jgi:hypothetical protein
MPKSCFFIKDGVRIDLENAHEHFSQKKTVRTKDEKVTTLDC